MLNVAYVSGFSTKSNHEERWFELSQTSNDLQDVRMHVSKDSEWKMPRTGAAITATCHIYGEQIPDPRHQPAEGEAQRMLFNVALRAFKTESASILSIPTPKDYFGNISPNRKNQVLPKGATHDMERAPYNADGTLKPEVEATLSSVPEEHMTDEGYISSMGNPTELDTRNNINKIQAATTREEMLEVIRAIHEASGKVNSTQGNSGMVMLAGCIHNARIVPPNDFVPKERLEILLTQNGVESESILVRYEPDFGPAPGAYASKLVIGAPIKIIGEVRVKPLFDQAGNVVGKTTYIRARRIETATLKVDIQSFPAWWVERAKIMNEAVRKREEDREVRRRRATDQAA
ncbi:hypothetical protein [Ferrovum myxofaciens]|uniref:Uncharacterized protein n=2 Tax=Ferrovum myxofaciens TaxID=416213 RepID=A0A9E6MWW5_9PROT|nr:hypothetical protein [Ferrovum myxofaciens]QKE37448.1 MAG: hypothetical protein HO273_00790 [Ferrovum myxofaciens]QWY75097.1 MAG: hypothetical protein JVY19_01210 [Ferrovum myxofaciens]QWY77833.1 MAG: hypothetical protein JZL65_01720 [Ferrovum myxofaciens]